MMNLMLGNNWTEDLLEGVVNLNAKYKDNDIQVTELYGSLLDNPIGTARPGYRVQDRSKDFFEKFVKEANFYDIKINYTLNIPCFGSLQDLKIKEHAFIDFLKYLEDSGVSRVTISHPLLIELVKKHSNLSVELSTIFEIDSISALREFVGKVDKICMKHAKNRDFKFLHAFNKEAIKNNIVVELMTNEFCYIYCIDRKQCYNLHGHTKEKNRLYDWYPMGRCINKRYQEPVEWIKAPFILPQWLDYYERNVNINHFKITGRTHPTPYILWTTEQYMKKFYNGNLLELWAQLENIGKNQDDYLAPAYELPIKNTFLEDTKFLDTIGGTGTSVDCSIDCENTCYICHNVLDDMNIKKIKERR